MLIKSPWFGYDVDYSSLLGEIERNASGHIMSTKTAQMVWKLKIPDDVEIVDTQYQTVNISSDAIFLYAYLMAGGYLLIFLYTIVMLGLGISISLSSTPLATADNPYQNISPLLLTHQRSP